MFAAKGGEAFEPTIRGAHEARRFDPHTGQPNWIRCPCSAASAVERHLGGVRTTWEERHRAAVPAQDLERARLVVRAAMAGGPAA